jgi:hypothetical protein
MKGVEVQYHPQRGGGAGIAELLLIRACTARAPLLLSMTDASLMIICVRAKHTHGPSLVIIQNIVKLGKKVIKNLNF